MHPVWTWRGGERGEGRGHVGHIDMRTQLCAAVVRRTPFTCTRSSDENLKRRRTRSQTHASVFTRPVRPPSKKIERKETKKEREKKEALNPCDKVQEKKVLWGVTDWRKMSSRSRNMINRLPVAKQGKMTVSQIRQEMGCSLWLIKRVYLLDVSANCAKAAKRSAQQR